MECASAYGAWLHPMIGGSNLSSTLITSALPTSRALAIWSGGWEQWAICIPSLNALCGPSVVVSYLWLVIELLIGAVYRICLQIGPPDNGPIWEFVQGNVSHCITAGS